MENTIFDFNDYRRFLRVEIRRRPKAGRGELQRLANFLAISSTTISHIFAGQKELSLEQAQGVCDYLGLPNLETDYFILLVQIERAGTHELKNYFRKKRDEIKRDSLQLKRLVSPSRRLDDTQRAVFYSSPLYSAVHLYTSVGEGKSLEQITQRFSLSNERARAIMQFLVDQGLCAFAGGVYKISQTSSHVERTSPFFIKHHNNWRISAIQKSESMSAEEFMFTANISISRDDFKAIRNTLAEMVQKLSKQVADSPAEEVANLNIDLFWV